MPSRRFSRASRFSERTVRRASRKSSRASVLISDTVRASPSRTLPATSLTTCWTPPITSLTVAASGRLGKGVDAHPGPTGTFLVSTAARFGSGPTLRVTESPPPPGLVASPDAFTPPESADALPLALVSPALALPEALAPSELTVTLPLAQKLPMQPPPLKVVPKGRITPTAVRNRKASGLILASCPVLTRAMPAYSVRKAEPSGGCFSS